MHLNIIFDDYFFRLSCYIFYFQPKFEMEKTMPKKMDINLRLISLVYTTTTIYIQSCVKDVLLQRRQQNNYKTLVRPEIRNSVCKHGVHFAKKDREY